MITHLRESYISVLIVAVLMSSCSSSEPVPDTNFSELLSSQRIGTMVGSEFQTLEMPLAVRGVEFAEDGPDQVLFLAVTVLDDYAWYDWLLAGSTPDEASRESLLAPLRVLADTLDAVGVHSNQYTLLIVDYDDALASSIEVPSSDFNDWVDGRISDEGFFGKLNIYGGQERPPRGSP